MGHLKQRKKQSVDRSLKRGICHVTGMILGGLKMIFYDWKKCVLPNISKIIWSVTLRKIGNFKNERYPSTQRCRFGGLSIADGWILRKRFARVCCKLWFHRLVWWRFFPHGRSSLNCGPARRLLSSDFSNCVPLSLCFIHFRNFNIKPRSNYSTKIFLYPRSKYVFFLNWIVVFIIPPLIWKNPRLLCGKCFALVIDFGTKSLKI